MMFCNFLLLKKKKKKVFMKDKLVKKIENVEMRVIK